MKWTVADETAADTMSGNGNEYEAHRRRQEQRAAYGDDSPESLRRRAELLLDEMMLGAVDGGSAVPGAQGAGWSGSGMDADSIAAAATRGIPSSTHQPSPGTDSHRDRLPSGNGAGADSNGNFASHTLGDDDWSNPLQSAVAGDQADRESGGGGAAHPVPPGRLVSAEERYLATGGTANSAATGRNGIEASTYASSAVRRQAASYASTMSVGMRTSSRSALLPRSSDVDIDALLEEIGSLRAAIAQVLPPGHEAGERSRHLLNKAQNLLQNDPARSAEVDYYLQQVRRTLQRARQARTGSAVYRRRITLYLVAWVLLGLVMVAGLTFGQVEGQALLEGWLGLPPGTPLVPLAGLVAGAMSAGALGAALASLIGMGRHARQQYGYFDRKYGLRSLLLPLLGAFFGLLVGLLWSAVYYFIDIDPHASFVAWGAPLLLAVVVGFGQEWLYGAR